MSKLDAHIERTKNWIKNFVIDLNLCPFAAEVYTSDKILFTGEGSENTHEQLIAFWNTLNTLDQSESYSTAILVLSNGPAGFEPYLELLDKAEQMLKEAGLEEKFQLAGFHPEYMFENSTEADPGNFVNRSPMPLIHILYVEDVSEAINNHPNINEVPVKNLDKMNSIGIQKLKAELIAYKTH